MVHTLMKKHDIIVINVDIKQQKKIALKHMLRQSMKKHDIIVISVDMKQQKKETLRNMLS